MTQEHKRAQIAEVNTSHISDDEILSLLALESKRQSEVLRLIPSENYVSMNVRKSLGSVLVNKYSEGYPGRRYYEGTGVVDRIEELARQRAKALFEVEHANVQPYSGSPANMAAYFALLKPGGTILGMGLSDGGHLTHGAPVNYSSKFYQAIPYHVDPDSGLLDMAKVREIAQECQPGIIICGGSAYPRHIDFAAFRTIADEVGAKLLVDMAHFGGLVAAKVHPSPVRYADVVTLTTHKVLRGPRGGLILAHQKYAKAIDRAVFPGLQGGPHNHTIGAIAIALKEASSHSFQEYGQAVLDNAQALANALIKEGFQLVTGGTDTHLMLIDLRNKRIPGKVLASSLAQAGIITNANTVPGETGSPKHPSGLRLGTPAVTTRGMAAEQMQWIAKKIAQVATSLEDTALLSKIKAEVTELTEGYPVDGLNVL